MKGSEEVKYMKIKDFFKECWNDYVELIGKYPNTTLFQ